MSQRVIEYTYRVPATMLDDDPALAEEIARLKNDTVTDIVQRGGFGIKGTVTADILRPGDGTVTPSAGIRIRVEVI